MSLPVRTVVSDDVTISYRDTGGTGRPVVILHGLAGSGREFVPTARALPEFRVVLVDLRAHGASTRRPADLSRAAYVADVVRVIEEAVGGPVALVGQSMGGHIAMLVAATRPDLVSALVLGESTVGGDGTQATRRAQREFFESWPVPFRDEQAAAEFLGDGPLARAWAADLDHRPDGLWPKFDPQAMTETAEGVDEQARWAEWQAITAPTLAVFAENGTFDEEAKREFVARGHNVHRVDFPRSGHDVHLDDPDAWTNALRMFLARHQ